MNDALPHILIVDDDTRLRAALRKYLASNGYRVTMAGDATEAQAKLRGIDFDLMVLDLMMPGMSGLDFAKELRKSSQVPILMLTAMGEPADRIAGLQSGADDYLPKPFEPQELLLRIGSILRRVNAPPAPPALVRFGDFSFEPAKGVLLKGTEPVSLTTSESALLKIFARTPGVTVSRSELGRQTGGNEGRAVDVQITRLRRKIESDPKTPRYLQTIWGEGYVLWVD